MAFFKRKVHFDDDLGFSSAPVVKNQRILNTNGSPNLERIGLAWFKFDDTYTRLVTMSWRHFFFVILVTYLIVNTIFAVIYNLIGIENLAGAGGKTKIDQFFDAFFFSAQTISTVGYGHISPKGFVTSIVAAFESMLGLLAFALATGLLYGRFSRPTSKITFTKQMVIAPYQHHTGLMCRLINHRRNSLIDVEAQMIISFNETVNGQLKRSFYPLTLERNSISYLTLNWTLVHPITEDSPIYQKTLEDLKIAEVEIFVAVKAFDDTFSQTIHSRTSYQDEDIVANAKFEVMHYHNKEGRTVLDYSLLDTIIDLNKTEKK